MLVILAASAMVLSIVMFTMLVYNKNSIKSSYLALLAICVSFYMIGNFIETVSPTVETALIGVKIRFLGVPFIPTLWFFCVREFCGLSFKKSYTVLLFTIAPIIFSFLALTWEYNHLMFTSAVFYNGNTSGTLLMTPGYFTYFRLFYQATINVVGVLTLVYYYRKGTAFFKKQAILFLISVLVPIFNSATYMVSFNNTAIDLTPYGLLIALILFIYTLSRYGMLNLSDIIKDNAINHMYQGVLLFDNQGIYMDSNQSAKNIFPQLNNVSLGSSVDEMPYLPFNSKILLESNNNKNTHEFTKELNGSLKTFTLSLSNVKYNDKAIGHSVILTNISSMKQLLSELKEKSITDPLTGLYNRAHLAQTGKAWFDNAKETGESFSVVMLDIDHFKNVNDSYGHPYGDYVLKTLASLCSSSLRGSDIMARYGGEEFCILLSNSTAQNAFRKAEVLREKISQYIFNNDGIKTTLTTSFGISSFHTDYKDFDEMVKAADEQLYKAKKTGRNRVCSTGQ